MSEEKPVNWVSGENIWEAARRQHPASRRPAHARLEQPRLDDRKRRLRHRDREGCGRTLGRTEGELAGADPEREDELKTMRAEAAHSFCSGSASLLSIRPI